VYINIGCNVNIVTLYVAFIMKPAIREIYPWNFRGSLVQSISRKVYLERNVFPLCTIKIYKHDKFCLN